MPEHIEMTAQILPSAKPTPTLKPVVIATGVLLLHVGGLVALQSGLLVRAYEAVVPAELISQLIEPPKPIAPPPAPAPAPTPAPQPPTTAVKRTTPTPPPAPMPLAISDPTPAPNAPVVTPTPPAPLPPITAPVATLPVPPAPPAPATPPPAPPAPAKVELPRSDADYLNNPLPPYPPVSKRLGEQGRVVMRVYVGEDGAPQKAEMRTSSGFERLDAAAAATVMRWRYKPGTRGGVPEAMWVSVPIDFKLD